MVVGVGGRRGGDLFEQGERQAPSIIFLRENDGGGRRRRGGNGGGGHEEREQDPQANLVNEAAILAVRRSRLSISMDELQEAIDRVIGGPQKKARVMSLLEQRRTAYHEGGHAVVGRFSENHDPVHKVSIVARGRLGGYTRFLPEEGRHYITRARLEAMIASALG